MAATAAPARAVAQSRPKLENVLKQAAAYVRQFENDFAAIVTDETYEQHDVAGQPRLLSSTNRRIRSEMLFMRLPGAGLSWISARNVLEVDGVPVADSHDRLERTIKGDAAGLADRLLSVADEGARFNIGRIQRNFNDPILPLLFLDPEYQPRFKFRLEKDEDIDGIRTRKISFKETERPTVIRGSDGRSLDTSGVAWVRADDATVVRTEIGAHDDRMTFTIRVDYHRDPKLDMWIPSRMEEHYKYQRANEQIDCVAVYSNARRFETSGRVIVR
jgi:hypothetical protein